jgi:hypothetical protein
MTGQWTCLGNRDWLRRLPRLPAQRGDEANKQSQMNRMRNAASWLLAVDDPSWHLGASQRARYGLGRSWCQAVAALMYPGELPAQLGNEFPFYFHFSFGLKSCHASRLLGEAMGSRRSVKRP